MHNFGFEFAGLVLSPRVNNLSLGFHSNHPPKLRFRSPSSILSAIRAIVVLPLVPVMATIGSLMNAEINSNSPVIFTPCCLAYSKILRCGATPGDRYHQVLRDKSFRRVRPQFKLDIIISLQADLSCEDSSGFDL
jgi:hypothetical protein